MTDRANPFGDLGDFAPAPAPAKPKADRAVIDQVAEAHGFPSRQPAKKLKQAPEVSQPVQRTQRRFKTGRNQQINIKATAETIERIGRMADERQVPLGRLLEIALDALENFS
jgi:hypothetical protein